MYRFFPILFAARQNDGAAAKIQERLRGCKCLCVLLHLIFGQGLEIIAVLRRSAEEERAVDDVQKFPVSV